MAQVSIWIVLYFGSLHVNKIEWPNLKIPKVPFKFLTLAIHTSLLTYQIKTHEATFL
jgi:hypothetical protein